jgi:hypothetical protein
MSGAAISHLVVGDPAWLVAVTTAFSVLTLISWALRPRARTLDGHFSRAVSAA